MFNLLRSYSVVESHEVEAKTEDEAIQKIENNPYDTMQLGRRKVMTGITPVMTMVLFSLYSKRLFGG